MLRDLIVAPFWLQATMVIGTPIAIGFTCFLAWNLWDALRATTWLVSEREDPPQLTRAIEQADEDTPRVMPPVTPASIAQAKAEARAERIRFGLDPETGHGRSDYPDCDDWKTEGPHWLKANPNLGVSLSSPAAKGFHRELRPVQRRNSKAKANPTTPIARCS